MARQKTTVYIEEDVLRAARVRAARNGRRDSDIAESALRAYLGFDLLERIWDRNAQAPLSEDEALGLAYDELHAMRAENAH